MDTSRDRAIEALLAFAILVVATIFVLGIVRSIVAFNPAFVHLRDAYDALRLGIGICGCLAAAVLFVGAATVSRRAARTGTVPEAAVTMRAEASLLLACGICASMMTPMLALQ